MPEFRHSPVPRAIRIAEEIQRILGDVFLTKVSIPGIGMPTITGVEVTRDLQIARVYMSFLNPEADKQTIMKELNHHRKEIRFLLGNQLRAKYIPDLRFFIDDTIERTSRIDAILEEIHGGKSADRE